MGRVGKGTPLKLEFSNTKAYWRSRFKATLWNAAYSTQWNIGPLSEMTFEKYGTRTRPPWNQNGTWPCKTRNCFTGVGQVDLVITPVGGLGWLLAEDSYGSRSSRSRGHLGRTPFMTLSR